MHADSIVAFSDGGEKRGGREFLRLLNLIERQAAIFAAAPRYQNLFQSFVGCHW